MPFRIIRIIALVLVAPTLLLGGCDLAGGLTPETDGPAIGFEAGSYLLRDDATKSADLLEGTDFAINQRIDVFGRYHNDMEDVLLFDGIEVEKQNASSWRYNPPLRFWEWESISDYYDFLGVYPTDKGSVMQIPGYLAVEAPYSIVRPGNIRGDDYDLLMAGYRRKGNVHNPNAVVPLNFRHALSAVRVVVFNESKDTDIQLDSYAFQHIIVNASAKITINALGEPEISWINSQRNTSVIATAIRGEAPDETLYAKNHEGSHIHTGDFDFFVPADLSETSNGSSSTDYMPHLILKYTPSGGQQVTKGILLKDIQQSDKSFIDTWQPGVKYIYYIGIRLDGGVRVTVITTEWDSVDAETQGLLIHLN